MEPEKKWNKGTAKTRVKGNRGNRVTKATGQQGEQGNRGKRVIRGTRLKGE